MRMWEGQRGDLGTDMLKLYIGIKFAKIIFLKTQDFKILLFQPNEEE